MSIYIPGMEMPKGNDLTIAIDLAGEVFSVGFDDTLETGVFLSYPCTYPIIAIPVPDHGRLGDLDALEEYISNDPACITVFDALKKLRSMPTIIPADHADKEVEA